METPTNGFIIHRHTAKKAGLHYDLRLRKGGVLLSWATRKLPDLIEGKVSKILLFEQPDHPLSWFDFEGEITDGYGAGKVEIWDKGTYKTEYWDDSDHYKVYFYGTKIKGEYTFIPYKTIKWQETWILLKNRG